ncbi:MAG: hypothetical protein M3164_01445 [Actinomycetota bacterium]|nr:hypothetical protein [Actinomycetota bacterium]
MERSSKSVAPAIALIVALLLHLVAGYFFLSSGLLAPLWAVALLLVVWVILLIVGIRNRDRPATVLLIPLLDVAVWFIVVQGGVLIFGWTP